VVDLRNRTGGTYREKKSLKRINTHRKAEDTSAPFHKAGSKTTSSGGNFQNFKIYNLTNKRVEHWQG
jgi:hypothetical protein